jgi:nucleoside-diphosphate-sugar epimerase
MRVLVSGASGYIGTHLVKSLASHDDCEIVAISRSSTQIRLRNVRHLSLDLSQPGWTRELPQSVDVVVHLAQSRQYRAFPEGVRDVVAINVNSTVDLADWAYRHRVKRFLFASTGNVYPTHMNRPLREEDAPCPATLYGASKLGAELLLQHYSALFETVVMRIFGIYGPGQRDMLIPATIRRILNNEEITLASGAGIYLSPLFVTDCVDMINALIRAPALKPLQHVNLAGPEVVSLSQIVVALEELLSHKARTVNTDANPIYLAGSGDVARQLTGHQTFVPLIEGLRYTVRGLEDA